MIANADGSIILTTEVDTSGIHTGTSTIKNDVNSASAGFRNLGKTIQDSLDSGNTRMATLANNARKATEAVEAQAQKVEELKNRYAQLQALSGLEQQRDTLGSQAVAAQKIGDIEKYAELQMEIETVTQSALIMREALGMKETDVTSQSIDTVNSKLSQQEEKLRNLSTQAEIAGKKLRNANKSAASSAKAAGNAFDKFGKRISGLVKRVFIFSVITKALRALRGVISNVLQDDEEFAKSLNDLKAALWVAFTPLINLIIPALKTFVNWLTIGITSLTKFIAALFNIPYSKLVADAKKMSSNAVKETKKAIKGQVAAFDEVTTLSSGSDDTAEAAQNLASSFESIGDFNIGKISKKLQTLMKVIGGALVAVGIILLFLGHPIIGIAAIIAGLSVFSIAATQGQETDPTKNVKTALNDLMTVVGLSLAAIGVILIFFGNLPLGISAVIAGLTIFGIAEVSGDEGEATEKIKKFIEDNSAAIVGLSIGLLVLGVILLFVGAAFPLALGLIAVGAVGLTAAITANWGHIRENITKFFRENAGIIAGMSAALLTLGILLLFVPPMIPMGIALIAAGAVGLVGTIALNWDTIVEKITGIAKKIGKVFSDLWDGIKKGFSLMLDGLVFIAKAPFNLIIDAINLLIAGLNKISFDVPDWVPGIGGKTFGFNIPKIPRLAKGGIVPYQTLAMIGEGNKKEAVLPLEQNTEWMDILAAKIASQIPSGGFSGTIEVPVNIDSREIARAVRTGENQLGNQTVFGRFANAY